MALALEFKDLYDELQALCMVILDKWSKYPTNEQPYGHRNIIARGGNIVADMRTIAFIAEQNADRTNSGRQVSLNTMARNIMSVLPEIYNFPIENFLRYST